MRGTFNQIVVRLIEALNDGPQPPKASTVLSQRLDADPILRSLGYQALADWLSVQLPDPFERSRR